MSKYAVNFLAQMLRIYSPTGEEGELASFLQSEMKKLGFKVRTDGAGNVIGEIGKDRPVTLLCGHMDTVPGRIPVRRVGNRLFGRGAVDAKGPLAAMILGAAEFARRKKSGKVIVAGVVQEEGVSKGIKALLSSGVRADYAVFGEPSSAGKITVGYRGRAEIKITCRSTGGHAGAPWMFMSAIEEAHQIWSNIKGHHFKGQRMDKRFYTVSTCLTRIKGGEAGNVVPTICEMIIDVRIPPQLTSKSVLKEIRQILTNYETRTGLEASMIVEDYMDPFESSADSPLVRAFRQAIRDEMKRPAKLIKKTGASDMNLFGTRYKIPIIAYGPGNSILEHTLNEYADIPEFLTGTRVIRRALENLSESFGKG